MLSPLAVRLLQLRDLARRDPERPAREVLDADLLAIVAALADQAPALIRHRSPLESRSTNGRLFGPKGAWKGWLRVQTLLEGVHPASHLRLYHVYKRRPFKEGMHKNVQGHPFISAFACLW